MATGNPNSTPSPRAANHSPRQSDLSSPKSHSPQSRRGMKAVPTPWTQIFRGESESPIVSPIVPTLLSSSTAAIEDLTSSSSLTVEEVAAENSENGNGGKRPAWNKPSNGAVAEVGPVMGAVSWPALSESARASAKSPSESMKVVSDGSPVSISEGTGAASSSSQKLVSSNPDPNSTPNHMVPRQRSSKRNGASSSSSNGGVSQQPAPPGPLVDMPPNNASPRDHTQRSGFASHSHSSNDHQQQQRNPFKNRNGGSYPRGDGSHHHNHGGRRDQDRGNQDWNNHRNFNSRDSHMQPQRNVRFIRPPPPPPNSTQFIAPPPPPPPVRPFGSPMGFPPELAPFYYVATPSPVPPPDPFVRPIPMFFPALDHQLHAKITAQIDYYFSNENLIKDTFLRQNMDDQGWVPIRLIAGFKKVKLLTDNIQLILDAVRTSTVVEVQGDKVRKRNEWMRWIMPPSIQFTGPQSPGMSNQDTLAAHVQIISLEEETNPGVE